MLSVGCRIAKLLPLVLPVSACVEQSQVAGVPESIDFNWHVRPILSDNCFRGHGLDAKRREAGLRLDVRESAVGELPESPGLPFAQGALKAGYGRDHHGGNFTWWMAGAGTKAGYAHDETDDLSYSIVKDPVHILGIDHERLTFRFQGRDFRLTDVHGKVVKEVLA